MLFLVRMLLRKSVLLLFFLHLIQMVPTPPPPPPHTPLQLDVQYPGSLFLHITLKVQYSFARRSRRHPPQNPLSISRAHPKPHEPHQHKPLRPCQVDAIIRSGLAKFTDEVGRLWCKLADHYIRLGQFERARDVFEEAINSVVRLSLGFFWAEFVT